jgi:predicted transcriptional regulator
MVVLIASVGVYKNRVLSCIAKFKPEKVYLLVTKATDTEYTGVWRKTTEKHAKNILKKISLFYDKEAVKIIDMDLGNFDECLSFLVSKVSDYDDVIIDITSSRKSFEIAAITAGILFSNASCVYIPPKNPQVPEDYSSKVIQDSGVEPVSIFTPKINFNELKAGVLNDILKTINSLGGKSETFIKIMREMGWEETRSNVIRFSKFLNRLEKYGCVRTEREGRKKSVVLTPLGQVISKL